MSDSNDLNITVTVSDAQAQAALRSIQASIRSVEAEIRRLSGSQDSNSGYVKALTAQVDAWKKQAEAIKSSTGALEQHKASFRSMLAEARANANWQNSNFDAVKAHYRSEAEYINRNNDLAYAAMRRLADYENAEFDRRAKRRQQEQQPSAAMAGQRPSAAMAGHVVAGFDELARGQRGALFSTIGAAARDAGLGVGALVGSVTALAAIMAASAILHGAEAMGKWATETRAAAAAAGMGLAEYSQLQGAMALVGIKGEEADASMRKLAESLATAISQPASKAAEAFHNMGITQEQLVATGGNVSNVLKLLAGAFVQTADGANKTQNMEEIAGRGFEKLIPLLQGGTEHLEAMKAETVKLGTALTDDGAAKLEAAGQAVEHLGQKIKGEGVAAMEAWAPVIIHVAQLLEGLLSVVGAVSSAVGGLFNLLGRAADLVDVNKYIHGPGGGASTPGVVDHMPQRQVPALEPATSPLAAMRMQMQQAALAAGQGAHDPKAARMAEAQAEIQVMQQTLATAQLTTEQKTSLATELAAKQTQLLNERLSAENAGSRAGAAAARQSYEDFASGERTKIAAANGSMAAIAGIYDEWLAAAEGRYKQHVSVIQGLEREKIQAVNTARLQTIKEGAELEESQNRAQAVMGQAQVIASGRTGKDRGVAQDITDAGAVEARMQQEVAALTEVMNTAAAGSDTQKAAAKEILSVVIQSKQEEIELYQKAAAATKAATDKILEPFKKLGDEIGSQFEGLTKSLVDALLAPKIDMIKQGLTTIKINERGTQVHQAMQKFALDMVNDAVKSLQEAAGQALFGTIAKMAGMQGVNSLGGLVAGGVGKLTGVASNQLNTAQFGIATTQLQTAATSLQAAAVTLQSASSGQALGSAAGAGANAASGAVSISTPIVSAITGQSAAYATTMASAVSGINVAAAANTTLLVGAIEGTGGLQEIELAALNAKPSLLGFTYARGGVVPSAAGGMVVGGNGASLAVLHAKEMVLPEHLSTGLQAMINNGGGRGGNNASLNYSPTINTSSRSRGGTGMTRSEFSEMMSTHGGALVGEARNMMRNGWRAG